MHPFPTSKQTIKRKQAPGKSDQEVACNFGSILLFCSARFFCLIHFILFLGYAIMLQRAARPNLVRSNMPGPLGKHSFDAILTHMDQHFLAATLYFWDPCTTKGSIFSQASVPNTSLVAAATAHPFLSFRFCTSLPKMSHTGK